LILSLAFTPERQLIRPIIPPQNLWDGDFLKECTPPSLPTGVETFSPLYIFRNLTPVRNKGKTQHLHVCFLPLQSVRLAAQLRALPIFSLIFLLLRSKGQACHSPPRCPGKASLHSFSLGYAFFHNYPSLPTGGPRGSSLAETFLQLLTVLFPTKLSRLWAVYDP